MESKTNADRIRAMTDEELVDVIHCPLAEVEGCIFGKSCALCILRWLRSPVESEANERIYEIAGNEIWVCAR